MIKANKIYNELSIYTENRIILWGGGDYLAKDYLEKLQWFDINVIAFCDNNSAIHGTKIEGVPVISPSELQAMLKENDDILVQIACETDEEVLVKQLQDLGVVNYISQKDMEHNFSYFKKYSDIDFDAKFPGNADGNHIRLTKIDSEFTIYKENKVVLWGAGKFGRQMLDLFKYQKLEVMAFCDNNKELHGTEINGTPVISPDRLKEMVDDGERIVVQIAYGSGDYSELYKQLKSMSIDKWVDYQEAKEILLYLKRYNRIKHNRDIKEKLNWSMYSKKMENRNIVKSMFLEDYLMTKFNNDALLVCSPPKTGDFTLNYTFDKNMVEYFNVGHIINAIRKNMFEDNYDRIKILIGIRENISQNLSFIYQILGVLGTEVSGVEYLEYMAYPFEISAALKNGGDIQYIYDKSAKYLHDKDVYANIEDFINRFCEKVIDIKKVPFDKEKGYTIVKEGNIEVFVYQLEKMNDIAKEVAEFVGGDFTQWEMGNVASDKWIADSYKQAQKEIRISQEYFDKCFSESYINHFYSEADIEKFKARWRPHIRESK